MPPKPDRRVFWLLERASAGVRQRIERLAIDQLDTTAAQLPVLFFLASKEACRPSELAEALGVNAAAITGITGRMEAAGVLRRRPAPDDGRAQQLTLTAAGKRIALAALPQIAGLQAELLDGFSPAEIETVMRFLRGVVERAPTLGEKQLATATDSTDDSTDDGDRASPGSDPRSAPARAAKTRRRSKP